MFENSFLVPLLEKYYPDEDSFNKHFEHLIKKAGDLYLDKELGLSINVTNIVDNKEGKRLINVLENNEHFESKLKGGFDEIDEYLFEKETKFSFKRYIFKTIGAIDTEIKDRNGNVVHFKLFVNIASTNLSYHIVTSTFTTWDTEQECIELSNSQTIDLLGEEFGELRRKVLLLFPEKKQNIIKNVIKKDRNTFISFEFWKDDWKVDNDNLLDARDYVKNHPHYFYSLVTLKKKIFRRRYNNIMDIFGRGFSASRVYIAVFTQNIFLDITIKPTGRQFETIGHDGSMFRIWEILALQRKLLFEINKTDSNSAEELIRKLERVYDFNTFITKEGKGVHWIKFIRYLQYITRIDFDYQVYKGKIEKETSLKLQRLNFLIIATIFVSISTFLLIDITSNLMNGSPAYAIIISLAVTAVVVIVFLYILPKFKTIIRL